jgi:hypothetical protein
VELEGGCRWWARRIEVRQATDTSREFSGNIHETVQKLLDSRRKRHPMVSITQAETGSRD